MVTKSQLELFGAEGDPQPLPGHGAYLGTGWGWYKQTPFGPRWLATCGCELSQGLGAYGTPGSLFSTYVCKSHDNDD